MTYKICTFLALILLASVSLAQTTHDAIVVDEFYGHDILNAETLVNHPIPIPLEKVTDTLSNYVAGKMSSHQVGVLLPENAMFPNGLIKKRRVIITFPPDFDLSTVSTVTYHDNDESSLDPYISGVYVYSESIVINIIEKKNNPHRPRQVFFTINSIENPSQVGDFRIVVSIDNFFRQTVAGPTHSEYFTIIPDEPVVLSISPSHPLSVKAGEIVSFEAFMADQYGNQIHSEYVDWTIDDSMDPIGIMYGSVFMATTVGQGRVIARAGDLSAESGVISVSAGEATLMRISNEADTVHSGAPLNKNIIVEIIDSFGNLDIDYIGEIWFSSDDSLAEILYNETNHFGFTTKDSGRAVFSGAQFIFKTAGQRLLTVHAPNGLSDNNDAIYVKDGGHTEFEIISPDFVRAGEPFELKVVNAQDGLGNPAFGIAKVIGGKTSPDGSEPVLQDIYIINGSGATMMRLYYAGVDTLIISYNNNEYLVVLNIHPGPTAEMEFDLEETQFIGNAFIGGMQITVYDAYGNIKTDYDENGSEVRFSSGTGEFDPQAIQSSRFANGVALITDFVFDGYPGLTVLTAEMVVDGEHLSHSAEFYANGIMADIGSFPLQVPQNWHMVVEAISENKGNLGPSSVMYMAGAEVDGSIRQIFPVDEFCIPHYSYGDGCYIRDELLIDMEPGEYEYKLNVEAKYTINGQIITTIFEVERSFHVSPFEPFEIGATTLPDTGFSEDYIVSSEIEILNQNSIYPPTGLFTISVRAVKGTLSYIMRDMGKIEYDWDQSTIFPIDIAFNTAMPLAVYDYVIVLQTVIHDYNGGVVTYKAQLPLDKTLSMEPRAKILINNNAITPSIVNAGSLAQFTIPTELIGSSFIRLNGIESKLIVTNGSVSSEARLAEDEYMMYPGITDIIGSALTIPGNWAGKTLTAKLIMIGSEADLLPVNQEVSFDFPITISSGSELKVVSLDVIAPNAPFVNTGQRFTVSAKILNNSDSDISGQIVLELESNGPSTVEEPVTISSISARDTITVIFDVIASGEPNPVEHFSMSISGTTKDLTLPNNSAHIIIQKPANLELSVKIQGRPGTIPIIDYEEEFSVIAQYKNNGQAKIEGGTLVLEYNGEGNFGIVFPAEIDLDSQLKWNMISPAIDVNSEFVIHWGEKPIDKNTGQPVVELSQPIVIPVLIQASITKLVIQPDSFDTRPLERGHTSVLFKLAVENVSNDERNSIQIRKIKIKVTNRDGNQIDGSVLITDTSSAFYCNDTVISSLEFDDGYLIYSFDSLFLRTGEKETIECRFTPKVDAFLDFFNMRLESENIHAYIASGPRIGDRVTASGILDRAFEISLPQAIIASEFGESFKNYPNPFNPNTEKTEFIYNLPTDSDVDIYIYSVTGARVRHIHCPSGSIGGQSSQLSRANWDGRNGKGDIVMNGVYIVYIEVKEGGLTSKLKIAVVK